MALQVEVDNQSGSVALVKVSPRHRGMAIACCCTALASLTPVALVQLHILKKLPDPPGRFFNSKKVVTSKGAYRFGIPDGLLGMASYGVTLALLMAAKPSRPIVQKMLRAKLGLDATMAIRKVRSQISDHGRLCSWCLGAAAATAGMVYFVRKAREEQRVHLV